MNRKDTCHDALVKRILTLAIAPGTLLDETRISEEFGISRTPLREVFQRLAGEGYLTLENNRSAKVSSMDLFSMRNFFQTAPMIYAAVGRLAAENARPDQIELLKDIQQKFRSSAEYSEPSEMAFHNHNFHKMIGEMAGNDYLTPSLNRLLIDHTRMSQIFFRPKNKNERLTVWEACDQHDQMIDAIEKGNTAEMADLTLQHWSLSRHTMEKFTRPDPLPADVELENA